MPKHGVEEGFNGVVAVIHKTHGIRTGEYGVHGLNGFAGIFTVGKYQRIHLGSGWNAKGRQWTGWCGVLQRFEMLFD